MALPDTISGVVYAGDQHDCLPEYVSGSTYAVFLDSTDEHVEMWASANPGTSAWAEQDSSNSPTATAKTHIVSVRDGNNIHIFTRDASGATNSDYRYHLFIVGTGWSVTDEDIEVDIDEDVADTDVHLGIAVRSGGDVVAVYSGASDSVHGTPYGRIDYNIRASGTWGGAVAVDDAGEVGYTLATCVLGASDKIHITYYDGTDIQHKSLNSSDTLSSAEAVNDTAVTDGISQLAYVNHATNGELIMAVWEKSSNSFIYSSLIDDDATPAAEAAISTAAILAIEFTVAADDTNDKFYAIWVDSGDSDIDHCEYSGSWGSVVSTEASITATAIAGANVYDNDDGDTVLAYLYDETTAGESYNEYVLIAGSGTKDFAATGSAAITGTTDLITTRDFGATSSAAITGTTDLVTTKDFSATDSAAISGTADLTVATIYDFAATGSAAITGSADLNVVRDYSATDSAAITGTTDLVTTRDFSATDSAAILGTANLVTAKDFSTTGSASISGTSNLITTKDFSATDSAAILGTTDLDIIVDFATTGSAAITGTTDLTVVAGSTKDFSATGSASISGSADVSISRDYSATDSASISGTTDLITTRDFGATSSAAISGTADVSVIRDYSATGSASISGTTDVLVIRDYSATDSAAITGSTDVSVIRDYSATDSASISGSVDLTVSGAVLLQVDSDNIYHLPARYWIHETDNRNWVDSLPARHWIHEAED